MTSQFADHTFGGAFPGAIRLPIEVEFDAAGTQLRSFRQVAERETASAAQSMQRNLTQAEQATTRSVAGMTSTTGKFTEQLRGAPGAISAVTQGLVLMGSRGSPAVLGLGAALSSVLASGFTPLGLALAGATGVVALMTSFGRGAEEAKGPTDRLTESLDAQATEWERIVAAMREHDRLKRAASAGVSPEMLNQIEDADSLRVQLAGIEAGRPIGSGNMSVEERIEFRFAQERYQRQRQDLLRRIAEAEQRQLALRVFEAEKGEGARITEEMKRRSAAQRRLDATGPLGLSDFGITDMDFLDPRSARESSLAGIPMTPTPPLGPMSDQIEAIVRSIVNRETGGAMGSIPGMGESAPGTMEALRAEDSARQASLQRQLELEALRTGQSVEQLQLAQEIGEIEREVAELRERQLPSEAEMLEAKEGQLEALRATLEFEEAITAEKARQAAEEKAKRARDADLADGRAFADAIGRTVEGAVAEGLLRAAEGGDWQQSLASAMRSIAGMFLRDALGQLTGSGDDNSIWRQLFGVAGQTGGALAGGGGGGDGGTDAGAGSEAGASAVGKSGTVEVVNITVHDQAHADALVAKASARGAHAFVNRAQAGRDTVKARRRA